jgi:putative ABC transport system permease protein
MWREIRFGARTLRRSPAFTVASIVTLALGIGANTAIFSLIDEILLRPFPLPHPEQLAQVYSFNRKTSSFVSGSYPDYEDFRRQSRSFRQLAAYVRLPLDVTFDQRVERVPVEAVTDNYFEMLEIPPLAGRTIGGEDESDGGPVATVAMIGETLWRQRFRGDPIILGKTIAINDHRFTIIGVVPKIFQGMNLNWGDPPEVWIPLHTCALLEPGFAAADIFHRRLPWLVLTGRLQPSTTAAKAEAELKTIAAGMARDQPATNRDLTARVFDLSRSKFWPSYRDSLASSLTVFAVAAGLVLLLACANVSNLMLQRALKRRREFAIRLAIGAGRMGLVRQLMAESLLLTFPALGCALLVARGLEAILLSFPGAFGVSLALDLSLERRVALFSVAISVAATMFFGLLPLFQAMRPDVWPALKDAGNGAPGRGRDWLRRGLVVVQVAFSVVLLLGGGLFARSLLKAYAVDAGFRQGNLSMAEFHFPSSLAAERVQSFRREVAERISAMPGVQAAALANHPLLSPVHVAYEVSSTAATASANGDLVGPGFLGTLDVPLIRGREFTKRDDERAPKVAIVNQTLAARLWPGQDAVGRTILRRQGAGPATPLLVVGIARDAKYHSVWEESEPHLYLPILQSALAGEYLVIRSRTAPEELFAGIRRQWAEIAPGVALLKLSTARGALDRSLGPQRSAAALLGGFACLAMLLASMGLYSIVAHSVAERTREIGVRMAMGARPEVVVRAIVAQALMLVLAGLLAGIAGGLAAARLIASQLKGVAAYDPVTFGVVAVLLMAVSLTAAWVPARRAARIDPALTLRYE